MKLLAVLAFVLLPAVAAAETYVIRQGEPAPVDGELLDIPAAIQASRDLTKFPLLQSEVETLKARVDAQAAQIVAQQQIIELKDQQIALKQQEIDLMKRVEDHMEKALQMAERANETAVKAAETSTKSLEKMQDKLDTANKVGFWGTVLGILGGLAAGLLLL